MGVFFSHFNNWFILYFITILIARLKLFCSHFNTWVKMYFIIFLIARLKLFCSQFNTWVNMYFYHLLVSRFKCILISCSYNKWDIIGIMMQLLLVHIYLSNHMPELAAFCFWCLNFRMSKLSAWFQKVKGNNQVLARECYIIDFDQFYFILMYPKSY